MGLFKDLCLLKETLYENQQARLLESEELLILSSLHSRLRIIFMNTITIGIFSSIFLRILISRYQITGFKGLSLHLLIPCTILNYYMICEYPKYKKGYLGKMIAFIEKKTEMDPEYEGKRREFIKKYQRKFYTNSQFWH